MKQFTCVETALAVAPLVTFRELDELESAGLGRISMLRDFQCPRFDD